MSDRPPDPAGSGRADLPASPACSLAARITSASLFAGAREVQIEHRGAIYRLKQTASGKLILTK